MSAVKPVRKLTAGSLRHRIYTICAKHAVKIERDSLRHMYEVNNGIKIYGDSEAVRYALKDLRDVLTGDDGIQVHDGEKIVGRDRLLIQWEKCSAVLPTIPAKCWGEGSKRHYADISVYTR